MKNILLMSMGIFLLTSCSKDSIDPGFDLANRPEKSEIKVRVSALEWTNESEELGCGATSQHVTFIENADIRLYQGNSAVSDITQLPLLSRNTDNEGSALLEDLEPGEYTVVVKTTLGDKYRVVTTQLKHRTSIDFSF
ncbi:MAG: hypothetical protein M3R25_00605 [Bacteroidota bacterium]|nr:hypothetical protein [Bacteroidota bacterium]